MREDALKARLRELRDGGFSIAEDEAFPLSLEIFEHLGSPDAELRDELGLTAIGSWIVDQGRLRPDELRELRRRALGDGGIRHRLGSSGDDSVFRRSFSLLVLAIVLHVDAQRRYLEPGEWREAVDAVVEYCEREQDVRGFVASGGWAHAVAHAADVVDELVTSRFGTPAASERLLVALDRLLARADEVFQAEEDERIAVALAAMVSRGHVPVERVLALVDSSDVARRAYRTNWKHVFRSLYFRLEADEVARRRLEAAQSKLVFG